MEQKLQCLEAVSRAEVDDEKRYLLARVVVVSIESMPTDARFPPEPGPGKRQEV